MFRNCCCCPGWWEGIYSILGWILSLLKMLFGLTWESRLQHLTFIWHLNLEAKADWQHFTAQTQILEETAIMFTAVGSELVSLLAASCCLIVFEAFSHLKTVYSPVLSPTVSVFQFKMHTEIKKFTNKVYFTVNKMLGLFSNKASFENV